LNKTRNGSTTLAQLLRRPELQYCSLPSRDDGLTEEVIQQVEITLKYAGYVERQEADVAKFRCMEEKQIPDWINYNEVPSLRTEARQKLNEVRPATLGHASRISGVSPADVCLVMIWMKRGPQN
jgi:tRNA uridine 5-carboxymethylaminomethyl modification enzyme